MKGDPSPYGTASKPVAEAAAAPVTSAAVMDAAAPKPALMLPDTAPESKAKVKPTTAAAASGSASAAAALSWFKAESVARLRRAAEEHGRPCR